MHAVRTASSAFLRNTRVVDMPPKIGGGRSTYRGLLARNRSAQYRPNPAAAPRPPAAQPQARGPSIACLRKLKEHCCSNAACARRPNLSAVVPLTGRRGRGGARQNMRARGPPQPAGAEHIL